MITVDSADEVEVSRVREGDSLRIALGRRWNFSRIYFTPAAWDQFVYKIKAGEYDNLLENPQCM